MKYYPKDKFKQLLLHEENTNIELGLYLLASLPDKQKYLTFLLMLSRYHFSKSVRKKIYHQLHPLPKGLLKSFNNLPDRQSSFDADQQTEQKANRVLQRIAAFPGIDAEELGNLMLLFKGIGVLFCHEQDIPVWSIDFPKVTHLNLSKVYTPGMGHILGHFSALESLNLSNNQLKKIPTEIAHLTQLQYIDLSNNLLTECKVLASLPYLTYVYLANNRLRELPEALGELEDLTIIDTSQNRLKKLPGSLCIHNYFYPHEPVLPNDLIKLQTEEDDYIQGNYIPDSRDDLMRSFIDATSSFDDYMYQEHKGNLPHPELWTEHRGVVRLSYVWMDWGDWCCELLPLKNVYLMGEENFHDVMYYYCSHDKTEVEYDETNRFQPMEQMLESLGKETFMDMHEASAFLLANGDLPAKEKTVFWQDWFALPEATNWLALEPGYDYRADAFATRQIQVADAWWNGEAMDGLMLETLQLYGQQVSYSDQYLLQHCLDDSIDNFLLTKAKTSPEKIPETIAKNGLWTGKLAVGEFDDWLAKEMDYY